MLEVVTRVRDVTRLRTRARALVSRLQLEAFERRLAAPKILAAFARSYPEAVFVQIGANDGLKHDHLRAHILRRQWNGVLVEPVPYLFDRLAANYDGIERVTLERAAISERDGCLPFFHVLDVSAEQRGALPEWYDGIGSFSLEAVLRHAHQIPDIEKYVVCSDVPTLSFETLYEKHGLARLDLLAIDTEGHDWEILRRIDFQAHRPRLLMYEHYHLTPAESVDCEAMLRGLGYLIKAEGFDTFCLDPFPDAVTKAFTQAEPAVQRLSIHEEDR